MPSCPACPHSGGSFVLGENGGHCRRQPLQLLGFLLFSPVQPQLPMFFCRSLSWLWRTFRPPLLPVFGVSVPPALQARLPRLSQCFFFFSPAPLQSCLTLLPRLLFELLCLLLVFPFRQPNPPLFLVPALPAPVADDPKTWPSPFSCLRPSSSSTRHSGLFYHPVPCCPPSPFSKSSVFLAAFAGVPNGSPPCQCTSHLICSLIGRFRLVISLVFEPLRFL